MPQILIVSDDTAFIEHLQKLDGYDFVVANEESLLNSTSFAVFFDAATLIDPQDIFLQLMQRRCRVIVVTTAENSHLAADFLRQGARDFMIKPLHPALIQKRLELLNELVGAKERLHVGIHDAKQPLAAILGYASLLKNPERFVKIPEDMRQKMFDSMYNGAVRLRDLLDDFDGFGV